MRILGYFIGQGIILNSDNEVCGKQSYLEFLLQPKLDTIRVMHNLAEGVQSLVGMLNLSSEEEYQLVKEGKLTTLPYHLRYVIGKLFSAKRQNAFAYYANASRYVKVVEEEVHLEPLVLARRAKDVGEQVYGILVGLGLNPTSLVNPARAYEKAQLKWLYSQKAEADGDSVKSGIIDEIGLEIYGRAWEDYCVGKR